MASRFVQIECPIEEFIQKQANKNTLSKTTRDLALLKECLKAKQVDKDVENIEPSELNELVSAFLVKVKK
jgi:site-specific recombinase XerD